MATDCLIFHFKVHIPLPLKKYSGGVGNKLYYFINPTKRGSEPYVVYYQDSYEYLVCEHFNGPSKILL